MRGKGFSKNCGHVEMGITPAYAGKSLAEFGKTSKAWDHPRLCGEKFYVIPYFVLHSGITPAYAGKS